MKGWEHDIKRLDAKVKADLKLEEDTYVKEDNEWLIVRT
jgi:hypothetical protein